MLTQSILLTALFSTPPTHVAPPDFADRIDTVDVSVSDLDAVLTALDRDGEPIGSLALWVDDDGTTWIASDYVDGSLVITVNQDGAESRSGDLSDAAAAERAEAMLAVIDYAEGPLAWEPGWASCGVTVALAVSLCAGSGPLGWLGCSAAAATATCECVKAANNGKAYKPCGKVPRK